MYHLFRLIRNQWLSPSEIEEIQRRKLNAIVRHAYQNVDYYRQLFDSVRVKPKDIRDKNDLFRIPITTKSQLQKLPIGKITAKGIKLDQCLQVKTSGSTGRPLDIIIGTKDSKIRGAVLMRALLANGYRLKDQGVDIGSLPRYYRNHWYQYLGIGRQKYILVFDEIDEQIRQMRKARPDIISADPIALRVLAQTIGQKEIKDIRPRMIISGGEILTPQAREFINSTFGIKMVDFYSSWEFGNIAWECNQHAGYHINVDSLVVEVINNGEHALPGERGELIITNLNSYAMPFIRYNIADIGVLSDRQCPCGRRLPLLGRIEGRKNDLIKLSNRRVVSPFTITAALRFISGVAQFRLTQEREDEFLVELERGKNFCQETIENVREELKKILGVDVQLRVESLDKIPRDTSGKLRSIISKVKS
jgi:phenylacetate-CoA ligase